MINKSLNFFKSHYVIILKALHVFLGELIEWMINPSSSHRRLGCNKDRAASVRTVLGYFNRSIYYNNETLSKAVVRTMHYTLNHESMVTTSTPKPQDSDHFTDRLNLCPTSLLMPLHSINYTSNIAVLPWCRCSVRISRLAI